MKYKRRATRERFSCFLCKTFLKLHFKWKFNPWIHTNREIFSNIRVLFVYFLKRQGKPLTLAFSNCAPKLIYFLKRGWYSSNFLFKTISKFSKNSLSAETDIECGQTKTTLYARGVNKSCKIITFSDLNSSNLMITSKITLCRKWLRQYWSYYSYHYLILVFSSSLRLGVFSNCFLMTSFTSLLVTLLVCDVTSKLNYWGR